MPRLSIQIAMVGDDNHTRIRQSWSPLSYEDFNNPALLNCADGTPANETERNLLERIRTAIDRSLLRFSRGERRRFEIQAARPPSIEIDDFSENYEIDEPRDIPQVTINSLRETIAHLRNADSMQLLTEAERMAIIGEVIPKEDEPLLKPKPRRLSRYERKPVI